MDVSPLIQTCPRQFMFFKKDFSLAFLFFFFFVSLFLSFFFYKEQRLTWTSPGKWFLHGYMLSLTETHSQIKIYPGLLWSPTRNLKVSRNSSFHLLWARTSLSHYTFAPLWVFELFVFSSEVLKSNWLSPMVPKFQVSKG